MCAQCWTAAATATAGAAGIRAWAAAYRPRWLTGRRLRLLTVCLLGVALIIASVRVG